MDSKSSFPKENQKRIFNQTFIKNQSPLQNKKLFAPFFQPLKKEIGSKNQHPSFIKPVKKSSFWNKPQKGVSLLIQEISNQKPEEVFEKVQRILDKSLSYSQECVGETLQRKGTIPKKSHKIWVTGIGEKAAEIPEVALQGFYQFVMDFPEWQHFLWILDEKEIPLTIAYLKKDLPMVEIRSISSLKNFKGKALFEYFLQNDFYCFASEPVRFNVLYEHGGLYSDLGWGVHKNAKKIFDVYDAVFLPNYDFHFLDVWCGAVGEKKPCLLNYLNYLDSYLTLNSVLGSLLPKGCFQISLLNVLPLTAFFYLDLDEEKDAVYFAEENEIFKKNRLGSWRTSKKFHNRTLQDFHKFGKEVLQEIFPRSKRVAYISSSNKTSTQNQLITTLLKEGLNTFHVEKLSSEELKDPQNLLTHFDFFLLEEKDCLKLAFHERKDWLEKNIYVLSSKPVDLHPTNKNSLGSLPPSELPFMPDFKGHFKVGSFLENEKEQDLFLEFAHFPLELFTAKTLVPTTLPFLDDQFQNGSTEVQINRYDLIDLYETNVPFETTEIEEFYQLNFSKTLKDLEDKRKTFFEQTLKQASKQSSTYKIPPISHRLWITNPKNPFEPPSELIENYIQSIKRQPSYWKHFFWTNVPHLLGKTIKILKERAPEIEIQDLATHESSFICSKKIQNLISKGWLTCAANILKAEILNIYGGLYTDIGLVIKKNIDFLLKQYDVIIARQLFLDKDADKFDSCCLASIKDSIFLKKFLFFMNTLTSESFPKSFFKKIKNSSNISGGHTLTPFLLFHLEENKTLLPLKLLYETKLGFKKGGEESLLFGHRGTSSWLLGRFGSQTITRCNQLFDFVNT